MGWERHQFAHFPLLSIRLKDIGILQSSASTILSLAQFALLSLALKIGLFLQALVKEVVKGAISFSSEEKSKTFSHSAEIN